MNLYEKAKAGILGKPKPVVGQARVFTTSRFGFPTYHALDSDGREIAMSREVAVYVHRSLGTALKSTK